MKLYLKEYDKSVSGTIMRYSSKLTYEQIIKKKYYKPVCESKNPELPWPGLY